jgi:hypothetical protein
VRFPLAAASAALLSAACATSSPAPAAPKPAPVEVKATGTTGEAVAVRTESVDATVRSVDVAARTLTLDLNGAVAGPFKVPPEVTRFDDVLAGDPVHIDVEQQLRLEVQPKGSPSVPYTVTGGGSSTAYAAGALATTGVQATVTVTAVDLATRKVSFQDPAGGTYDVQAGPGLAIEKLAVGDRLLATYVEAKAVRLEKAAKKP